MEFFIYGPKSINEVKIAVVVQTVSDDPLVNQNKIKDIEPIIRKKTNFQRKINFVLVEMITKEGFIKKVSSGDPFLVNNEIFNTKIYHTQHYRVRIWDALEFKEIPIPLYNSIRLVFKPNIWRVPNLAFNLQKKPGFLNKLKIAQETDMFQYPHINKMIAQQMAKNLCKAYTPLFELKIFTEDEVNDSYLRIKPYIKGTYTDFKAFETEFRFICKRIENFFFPKISLSQNKTVLKK